MAKRPTARLAKKICDDVSNNGLSVDDGRFSATLPQGDKKFLNDTELKAVAGMIAYVAYTQKAQEDVICEVVASHFGVSAVAVLPSSLYQSAIAYLVDLKMDRIFN
jgi:hypothetical protein